MLEDREKILKNWIVCEEALAQKSPTMEAEYALDERTPLTFYDCLVPLLKEQRRFKIMPDTTMTIQDFKSQLKTLQLQRELEQQRIPRLIEENGKLSAQVKQLLAELEIVHWYKDALDDGIDSREILQEYSELKKRYK